MVVKYGLQEGMRMIDQRHDKDVAMKKNDRNKMNGTLGK